MSGLTLCLQPPHSLRLDTSHIRLLVQIPHCPLAVRPFGFRIRRVLLALPKLTDIPSPFFAELPVPYEPLLAKISQLCHTDIRSTVDIYCP